MTTHSAECYKWHHACAVAEVERLRAALAEPPPQRKPLTEDEIEQLLSKYERNYDMVNFARAIERAHGIK